MFDLSSIVYILFITILAVWAYIVLTKNKEQTQRLEKLVRERKTIYAFLDNFGDHLTTGAVSLEPTLEIITEFACDATDAEAGAAYLLNDEGTFLTAKVVHGAFPPMVRTSGYILTKQKYLNDHVKRERIPVGEGIIGEVAKSGTPILIKDAALNSQIPKLDNPGIAIRSLMVAPLLLRGKVLGIIVLVNKRTVGSFHDEELDLLVSVADQAASTIELVKLYDDLSKKQRIEQELKIAHDFQKMLLPAQAPKIDGFELAGFYEPALEVGGDYYDFIYIDHEKRYLGIAIADVSGKGIPGGLIMAVVRCTMRAIAPNNLSPRDVLIKVNERVYNDTKDNVFVTITYGILDTIEKTFKFVRAGHEPVVVIPASKGAVKLSSPPGMAVGLVSSDIFSIIQEEEIKLHAGESMVLYTDGVIEAMDNKQGEYGQTRLYNLIQDNRNCSPEVMIEKILTDIKIFTDGYPQHDDITLLTLRVLSNDLKTNLTQNQHPAMKTNQEVMQ